jgi:glycosyltransferase 2 family protein
MLSPSDVPPSPEQRLRLKAILGNLTRWAFALFILLAAGREILDGLKQLERTEISFLFLPLVLSAGLYAAGMSCFGSYWWHTLHDMGGHLGWLETQRAYFASQLGKYIPGKAWVLLIRCALTERKSVSKTVVVASSFYETLAVMTVGSLVALLTLSGAGKVSTAVLSLAFTFSAALAMLVHPSVFARLLAVGMLPFQKWGAGPVSPIRGATLLKGLRYLIPGWGLLGLSLVATAKGIGVSVSGLLAVLLVSGSKALAVAGGFAVLIVPAGLGVREWILMQTLGPAMGVGNAVLIAIVDRILNVLAESLAAAGLYVFVKRDAKNA